MMYINKGTRVRVLDQYSLVLEVAKRRKNNDTGKSKQVWKVVGYYGSVPKAMKGLLEHQLYESIKQKQTIESLIKKVEEMELRLEKNYDTRRS